MMALAWQGNGFFKLHINARIAVEHANVIVRDKAVIAIYGWTRRNWSLETTGF